MPDPTEDVLSRVPPDAVDQPRPSNPRFCDRKETVAVAEPCPACGCRWVTDPTAVIPEGSVDCGYCGAMRGYVHRDVRLSEFADGEAATRGADREIEYSWAGSSPFLNWGDLRELARECVRADPPGSYLTELSALARRSPYERQVYLTDQTAALHRQNNP